MVLFNFLINRFNFLINRFDFLVRFVSRQNERKEKRKVLLKELRLFLQTIRFLFKQKPPFFN